MKTWYRLLGVVAVAALIGGTVSACGGKKELDPSVIANLQAAYNGESNASAKYAMYAEKAAEAGYKSVAALFRATSKSESLHAARQAKVLRSYGIEPKAEIKLPEFTSMADALQDGIKGETYELTTMYPEFITNAETKGAPADVIEAFRFALEAEKEHAKLYAGALNDLENWKAPGKNFYVCVVCGYTTDNGAISACPLCSAPNEKFEVFK